MSQDLGVVCLTLLTLLAGLFFLGSKKTSTPTSFGNWHSSSPFPTQFTGSSKNNELELECNY